MALALAAPYLPQHLSLTHNSSGLKGADAIRMAGRLLVLLTNFILLVNLQAGEARRYTSRIHARPPIYAHVHKPIDGRWHSPEAEKYYNNPEGAKIIKASHFDLEYVLGHKIAFICVAIGSPRPRITWFKNGIEISSHKFLQVHEWHHGPDRLKSKIEIDPATQMDAGIYECLANNMYNLDKRTFRTDFAISFD